MRSRVARTAWTAAGMAFVAVGIAGALLPLLPTTPFLLLAAACFFRGSPRAHDWLLSHPTFGEAIRDFRAGRGVRARTKAVAIATMAVSMGASAYVVGRLDVAVGLLVVGACVAIYLLRLPTAPARR
jgi:uncharacterized membrane protein YbaN (DUF454 family)